MKMPVNMMPRLYLGTMTFGWSQTSSRVDESIALKMVQQFVHHNLQEEGQPLHYVDTARIYAGGKTEPIVGNVLSKCLDQQHKQDSSKPVMFAIGTKAHPSQPGGLSTEGIESQLQASLEAMKSLKDGGNEQNLSPLAEFYLHQPDTEHDLRESLICMHRLVQQGLIEKVGMSNYHASEMERAFSICQEENLTPPTVYQGLYNPLNRMVEDELLPLLHKHNCSFVAYNPLAAGLLAGKHTSLEIVQKGRFKNNTNYLPRFYTNANFQAVDLIRTACAQCQAEDGKAMSMVEATYRWLLCHSALTKHDGVLLGASSLAQLDQNSQACAAAQSAEALPPTVLDAFDQAWAITKEEGCFPYWRSYSADMPNRESLDPGASYKASKTTNTK